MIRSRPRRRLVVALLAVLAAPVARGEDARRPPEIVEDLYDVHFVDSRRGWIVGAFGAIYHTTDGGEHWIAERSGSNQHLYGVWFVDAERGWAVGRSGEVLSTRDSGRHWAEQDSGTRKHLFKVCFPDAERGWAVGDWGAVLHTSDGGATWEDRSLGEDQILYAIDFADRENGWMVGEFGSIRRTADGGRTWRKQDSGTRKTFFGLAAVTAEQAWAVGIDGLVERTRDGGSSWEIQRGTRSAGELEERSASDLLREPSLYDVEVRGGKGYIVGDLGRVLVSEDGGETWAAAPLPEPWRFAWLRGLSVLPSGSGVLVGQAGLTIAADGRRMRASRGRD